MLAVRGGAIHYKTGGEASYQEEEVRSADRVTSGELQFSSIFCPVPVAVWGSLGSVCEVLFVIEGGA